MGEFHATGCGLWNPQIVCEGVGAGGGLPKKWSTFASFGEGGLWVRVVLLGAGGGGGG